MRGDHPDFRDYCEAACVKLWGEPDKRTKTELSWKGGDAYGHRVFDRRKRVWFDGKAQRGGSTLELVDFVKGRPPRKLRGKAFFEVWGEAFEMGLIPVAPPAKQPGGADKPIRATFAYRDEQGAPLFEVLRFDTDDPEARFRQRQPDGKGGWIWNIKGVRRVLYRLPELVAAVKAGQRVLVTEGEKDAETAIKLGYVATTAPGGINKWLADYDRFLAGADVVVVSDNDQQAKDPKTGKPQFHPNGKPVLPGQDHAAKLAKRLAKIAISVRVIMFDVKDLSDWVAAGGTGEALEDIIARAPAMPVSDKRQDEKEDEDQPPPIDEADADAEIARLAKLSAFAYERERKHVAERLGITRLSFLDKMVEAKRAEDDVDDGKQGQPIAFLEPEPWGQPVDGAELLDAIATVVRKHVVMSDHSRDLIALWVVYAYLFDCFLVAPRLALRSLVRGCGKTTLLDVLEHLVSKPLRTSGVTASVTFRVIASHHPTLLIDEVDKLLKKDQAGELLSVLNDGHRRGGRTLRNVAVGDSYEPRSFATFSALALALIGTLPPELHDRSVVVDLKRRLRSETAAQLRVGHTGHLDALPPKILRWATDHRAAVAAADPKMPEGIYNREADNAAPLLAIADVVGGDGEKGWPQRARKAIEANHQAHSDTASRLELLLGDIRNISKGKLSMTSADLVDELAAIEGHPWAEYGKAGKPMTQHALARMLSPLKITTEPIGADRLKGYVFAHFKEAFERYLPPEGVSQPFNRSKPDEMGTSEHFATAQPDSKKSGSKCEKPANDGLLNGRTVRNGGSGEKTRVRTKMRRDEILRSTAGNPVYTGPMAEVPEQGPDPLDEHGAPRAAAPGLSSRRIHELADWYSDQGHRRYNENALATAELDAELRAILREEVFPEFVEAEFERVMQVVFAV
jgi:hypothetical protein